MSFDLIPPKSVKICRLWRISTNYTGRFSKTVLMRISFFAIFFYLNINNSRVILFECYTLLCFPIDTISLRMSKSSNMFLAYISSHEIMCYKYFPDYLCAINPDSILCVWEKHVAVYFMPTRCSSVICWVLPDKRSYFPRYLTSLYVPGSKRISKKYKVSIFFVIRFRFENSIIHIIISSCYTTIHYYLSWITSSPYSPCCYY